MGQAFLNDAQDDEIREEYPKRFEFDVEKMRAIVGEYNGMMLAVAVMLLIFTLFAGFVFPWVKIISGSAVLFLLAAIGVSGVNSTRTASVVVIDNDHFLVNEDRYEIEGTKIKIAPAVPFAGGSNNIYLTVKTKEGSKKYWVGAKSDKAAAIVADDIKAELKKISPALFG